MKKHYRHENDCLNCGTILEGKFCHNCGQENLEMKESFGHMINHAVSDYFHFDYQFFHTLKPLFAKPGKLTVDYLEGRRAQYLHPVKMYIFISLIFFVLFFRQNGQDMVKINTTGTSGKLLADTIKNSIAKDIDADKSLTPQEKKEAKAKVNRYLPGVVKIPDSGKVSNVPHSPKPVAKLTNADANTNFRIMSSDGGPPTYADYLVQQNKLPAVKRDGFFKRYLKKKGYDWEKQGTNAREMFTEGLQHNAPKMMFLLLPLLAFILSIAFRKNHKFYVEHVIYSLHLHCFLFLFLAAEIILKMIVPLSWKPLTDFLDLIAFIAVIWYVYRSLKVVYKRSRWRTISKMIGVSMMYFFVFGVCFLLIAAITALTTI